MDEPGLLAAFSRLKQGTLWTNPAWAKAHRAHRSTQGLCAGYADANPAEAAALQTFVEALAAGKNPTRPQMGTATGQGLVGLLTAAAGPAPGLAGSLPVWTGGVLFQTADDNEQVAILIDGRAVAKMGPKAAYTLDTSQFANGQHQLMTIAYDADGHEIGRTAAKTIQVRN